MATKKQEESATPKEAGAKHKEETGKHKAEGADHKADAKHHKHDDAAGKTEPVTHKFYCVKCKESVQVPEADTRVEMAKNGHPMRKGKCPTCGTNLNRILGKNDVQ